MPAARTCQLAKTDLRVHVQGYPHQRLSRLVPHVTSLHIIKKASASTPTGSAVLT